MTITNKNILEIKSVTPYVGGWLEIKLPKSTIDRLWSYTKKAKIDYRSKLAGNISKELILIDQDNWFFNNVLTDIIKTYEESFRNLSGTNLTYNHPYILNKFWVNYQKQTEFNPFHDHTGIYSFVIWMQLPYDYKKQQNLSFVKNSNAPRASIFEFTYINILGGLKTVYYKGIEGHMLFHPAQLSHQVYPFYNCSKERISISGNIYLDSKYTI